MGDLQRLVYTASCCGKSFFPIENCCVCVERGRRLFVDGAAKEAVIGERGELTVVSAA